MNRKMIMNSVAAGIVCLGLSSCAPRKTETLETIAESDSDIQTVSRDTRIAMTPLEFGKVTDNIWKGEFGGINVVFYMDKNSFSEGSLKIGGEEDSILVRNFNNGNVGVTLTPYRAKERASFIFAHNSGDNIHKKLELADKHGRKIHVAEGEKIERGEYVIIPDKILEAKTIYNASHDYSNDDVRLEDVLGHQTYSATITGQGKGHVIMAGLTYGLTYFHDRQTNERHITLDYPQSKGDKKVISPRIKLKGGDSSIAIGTLDNLRDAYDLDVSGDNPALMFTRNSGGKESYVVAPVYDASGPEIGIVDFGKSPMVGSR